MNSFFTTYYDAGMAFLLPFLPSFLRPSPPKKPAEELRQAMVVLERAYAAGKIGGAYQLWRGTYDSGEAEVKRARSRVTARARDLDQNNPFVASIADKRSVKILGDEIGITPQVMIGSNLNVAVNKTLEERFYRWAETAFLDGSSLTEGFQLASNHDLFDGECLIKRVIMPDVSGNPLRFQGLETDQLDNNVGTQGITYDASGMIPITYHLRTIHPNDPDMQGGATVAVPASDIFHLRSVRRFSQRRGISPLAPAIMRLYGIDDLEDAELQACRSAASVAVITQSPTAGSFPTGHYVGPDGTDGTVSPIKDGNNKARRYLESGAWLDLGEGEDAKVFNSNRPNGNFDPFIRNRKRDTAGPAGLSYEDATGDFSQSNFSASRMAQMTPWMLNQRQQKRYKKILNWIYRQWLALEVLFIGVAGISRAAFASDPIPFQAVTWQLAGNQGIDLLKEVETLEKEVALGVNSRTNYCAERGRDRGEITKQLITEKADLVAANLYQEDPVAQKTTSEVQTTQPGQGSESNA